MTPIGSSSFYRYVDKDPYYCTRCGRTLRYISQKYNNNDWYILIAECPQRRWFKNRDHTRTIVSRFQADTKSRFDTYTGKRVKDD